MADTFGYDNEKEEEAEEWVDPKDLVYLAVDADHEFIEWFKTHEEAIEAAEEEMSDGPADKEIFILKQTATVSAKFVVETNDV